MAALEDNPFTWRITKDDRVLIARNGRTVTIRAGASGWSLAAALRVADDDAAQHLLARATGNYKHGNERH